MAKKHELALATGVSALSKQRAETEAVNTRLKELLTERDQQKLELDACFHSRDVSESKLAAMEENFLVVQRELEGTRSLHSSELQQHLVSAQESQRKLALLEDDHGKLRRYVEASSREKMEHERRAKESFVQSERMSSQMIVSLQESSESHRTDQRASETKDLELEEDQRSLFECQRKKLKDLNEAAYQNEDSLDIADNLGVSSGIGKAEPNEAVALLYFEGRTPKDQITVLNDRASEESANSLDESGVIEAESPAGFFKMDEHIPIRIEQEYSMASCSKDLE